MSGNAVKAEFAKLAGRFFEHGARHEGDDAPWCHLEACPFEPNFDPATVETDQLIAKAGFRAETHSFICLIRPLSKNGPWGILLLQKSSGRGEVYRPFRAYLELAKRAGLLLARLPNSVMMTTGECLERYFDGWGFEPCGHDRAWTALAWYASQQPGQQKQHYVSPTAIYVNPFLASADMIHLCGFDGDEPAFPPSTKRQGSKSVKDKRSASQRATRLSETMNSLLLDHHGYNDRSCTNCEPIGVTEMARRIAEAMKKGDAKSFKGSASRYFKTKFHGHERYKRVCADKSTLISRMLVIAGDVSALERSADVDPDDLADDSTLADEQRRKMQSEKARKPKRRRSDSDD